MSKVQEVLLKAKELIKDPANWMQGKFTNESRTCFCALGAVAVAKGCSFDVAYATTAAEVLKEAVSDHSSFDGPYKETFAVYNDASTHDEVMAAFDKAIQIAKQRDL